MSGAMRRIAPAVLVGTAAVLVVGAADPGLATLLTGDDNTTTNAAKTASSTTAEANSVAPSSSNSQPPRGVGTCAVGSLSARSQ